MKLQWLQKAEADAVGIAEERVLLEQTPAHYPEYAAFLEKQGTELLTTTAVNLKTAVAMPPDAQTSTAADVCVKSICHPLGETARQLATLAYARGSACKFIPLTEPRA